MIQVLTLNIKVSLINQTPTKKEEIGTSLRFLQLQRKRWDCRTAFAMTFYVVGLPHCVRNDIFLSLTYYGFDESSLYIKH